MIKSLSTSKVGRMRPPTRRVLAVDAGSRRMKLLLAQSDFGRLRILREDLLDLQAEGLLSPEEIKAHLLKSIEDWGSPPLALVLPQHVSISQVVDLPAAPQSEIEKLIADEAIKLSGVSETRIVYDFVRTEAQLPNRQQFWVTLSREGEIRDRIARLGVEHEDICEVTTTANALIAAYRAAAPLSSRAILVHLGAQTTVVAIVVAGQGAFAASFQMGGDFFTRALARARNSSEEAAESYKRNHDVLNGPEAVPEFASAANGWLAELNRQIGEWFDSRSGDRDLGAFELIASGGGFDQPGLLTYLEKSAGLVFKSWPNPSPPEPASPSRGFEIAFGTALQALGFSAQPVSLLPEVYKVEWQKRSVRDRIDAAAFVIAVVCLIALAFGTWRKLALISAKETLLRKVEAGQEAVDANDALTGELYSEYENARPVFAAEQNTADTLKTLGVLQRARTNDASWYVLVADQQSYFTQPPFVPVTNSATTNSNTNLTAVPLRSALAPFLLGPPTNFTPAKPGYIAELCVPGDSESARKFLSSLVNDLKQQSLFSKADLLSPDLRRNLADPKVLVPDRNFALSLDFATSEFQQPLRPRKSLASKYRSPLRRSPRVSEASPVEVMP